MERDLFIFIFLWDDSFVKVWGEKVLEVKNIVEFLFYEWDY